MAPGVAAAPSEEASPDAPPRPAAAPDSSESDSAPPPTLTPSQLRKAVADNLRLINGLPPRECEISNLGGRPAASILALGIQAAPYLVERLTDATPSSYSDFCAVPYRIGDYAEQILGDLYGCTPGLPNRPQMPTVSCPSCETAAIPCREYHDFLNRPGERARLQAKWARFIALNGGR